MFLWSHLLRQLSDEDIKGGIFSKYFAALHWTSNSVSPASTVPWDPFTSDAIVIMCSTSGEHYKALIFEAKIGWVWF